MSVCIIGDGRSIHNQRWILALAKRGYDIDFITYPEKGLALPARVEGGGKIVVHTVGFPISNYYLSFWPRHLRITRLVKKMKPDLVHAMFITKYGFHLPFLNCECPKIVSGWGSDVYVLPRGNPLLFRFTQMALHCADRIYPNCNHMKETFLKEFNCGSGIRPNVIKIVPYGVDTNFFTPQYDEKVQSKVIYSNRRFEPVSDPETVIDGFDLAHRRNSDIRLIIRGAGSLKKTVFNHVINCGLERYVQILDWGTPEDVRADLHRAGIYLSTTRSDGSATSVLEAMSSGLICIATGVGGIPEWIRDGENGFLIPIHSAQDLGERIEQVMDDPELRTRIGERARETVQKVANWDVIMDGVARDYTSLIQ